MILDQSWSVSKPACLLHVLLHDMWCFHAKKSMEMFLKTLTASTSRKATVNFLGELELILLTKLLIPQPSLYHCFSHGTIRVQFVFTTFPQLFSSQQLLTVYHDIMTTPELGIVMVQGWEKKMGAKEDQDTAPIQFGELINEANKVISGK